MDPALLVLAAVLFAREYIHYREMRQEAEQRNMLLQRVQAPREIAYKEFAETLPPGAPSEPIWSDEDAWKALGHLPPDAEVRMMENGRTFPVENWNKAMKDSE